jgi:hypothetical protein
MGSRGWLGGAGPAQSHRSTTADEVAVGDHRWSRPVERKVMTGGAVVSVREGEAGARVWAGHDVGPRARLGQASERARESAGALSGRAAGPSRGRRKEAARGGFCFSFFKKCKIVFSFV